MSRAITNQRALIAALMILRDNAPLPQYAAHDDVVYSARVTLMHLAETQDERDAVAYVPVSFWDGFKGRIFGPVPVMVVGDA